MKLGLEAVVFDLDGTLVDSYRPITASLNAARRAFDLEALEVETVRRQVGHGLESLIELHLGAGRVAEGVRIFRAHYAEIAEAQTDPLPGVPEVLEDLATCGLRLGVASNKPARFIMPLLKSVGLGAVVPVAVGPAPDLPPKPDPAILLEALRRLGTPPERAAYVGDMPIDWETARAAGVRVYLVPSGSSPREELEALPDSVVAEDLRKVAALLISQRISE